MKGEMIIVILLVLVILFLCTGFGSYNVSPYSGKSSSLQFSNVEGFNTLAYSSLESHSAKDDTKLNYSIEKDASKCKKVSGFNGCGVFCDPSAPSQKVDIYSDAKGDLNCKGVGYYNSRGPLCLDQNMIQQLSTRGNNSSNVPSDVAGSSV